MDILKVTVSLEDRHFTKANKYTEFLPEPENAWRSPITNAIYDALAQANLDNLDPLYKECLDVTYPYTVRTMDRYIFLYCESVPFDVVLAIAPMPVDIDIVAPAQFEVAFKIVDDEDLDNLS